MLKLTEIEGLDRFIANVCTLNCFPGKGPTMLMQLTRVYDDFPFQGIRLVFFDYFEFSEDALP